MKYINEPRLGPAGFFNDLICKSMTVPAATRLKSVSWIIVGLSEWLPPLIIDIIEIITNLIYVYYNKN